MEAVAQAPQPVQANGKVKAEMGDPAMEEVGLWEIAPGGDYFVSFSFLPKFQQKSSFLYLWVVDGPNLDHTHPPLSSACSIGRFESAIKGPNHAAPAQPWNQVSVAPHTQTPLQSTHRKKKARAASLHSTSLPHCGYIGGSTGHACTVSGSLASIAHPISLAPSDHQTDVQTSDHHVLRAEIAVPLVKYAIEPVLPADMKVGFYSPYFSVPKQAGGLQSILDLCVLYQALHRLPFRMLMQKCLFGCIRQLYNMQPC